MPLIDLDAPAPAGASHRARRGPRLLAMSAAAALVLSLPGEAGPAPSIFDDLCGYLAAAGGHRTSVVLLDVDSGEAVQSTAIEVDCPAGG